MLTLSRPSVVLSPRSTRSRRTQPTRRWSLLRIVWHPLPATPAHVCTSVAWRPSPAQRLSAPMRHWRAHVSALSGPLYRHVRRTSRPSRPTRQHSMRRRKPATRPCSSTSGTYAPRNMTLLKANARAARHRSE